MGWIYRYDRSKESLIEEIKFQNEVIDSAICRGDGKNCKWIFYAVCKNLDRQKYITIYLLDRDEEGYWGYQSMSERDGPDVFTCPKRILQQSEVDDRYGWRAECCKRKGFKPL